MEQGNKSELLKKVLMPAGITLGVILVIGFLLYLLAIPFDIYIIKKLHSYVVTKIVNTTGLSQWLVKGIVIILLIPLLWVLPNIYMGKHKKPARAVGLLYFSIFFLSLFFLSKDLYFAHSGNEILKWYALTPEGVKFYDSAGIDPVYGIKLKPVTPDVIRKLKLLQKGDFKPIDPVNAQFFNPITGEAQVWFYKYPDGSCEFYDKPGYHPVTGDVLKPVSKNIYFEWQKKEKAKIANSQAKVEREPNTKQPNSQTTESSGENTPDLSHSPEWIRKLKNSNLIPGVGVAGIRLGDSENTVIDNLGQPNTILPVKNVSGAIMDYALQYMHGGVFLGLYTTPDSRRVYSFRLYDSDFNKNHLIPRLPQGITVGSSVEELLRAFGNPQKIDRHFTCPDNLGKRDAESFYYTGIVFCVCNVNNLIYWIDIHQSDLKESAPSRFKIAQITGIIRSFNASLGIITIDSLIHKESLTLKVTDQTKYLDMKGIHDLSPGVQVVIKYRFAAGTPREPVNPTVFSIRLRTKG